VKGARASMPLFYNLTTKKNKTLLFLSTVGIPINASLALANTEVTALELRDFSVGCSTGNLA